MTITLGIGSLGNDVRRLQEYLNSELSASLVTDGAFGGRTKDEVLRFRKKFGLAPSPVFDQQCEVVSRPRGFHFPDFDPDPAKKDARWPRKRKGLSSPSGELMQSKCGKIEFRHTPVSRNAEHITITNSFEHDHIVTVEVPQLKDCVVDLDPGVAKTDGRIRFHKSHADRLVKLFDDWEKADLLDRILTFDGSYNARLKRGATKATVANLSNHA